MTAQVIVRPQQSSTKHLLLKVKLKSLKVAVHFKRI